MYRDAINRVPILFVFILFSFLSCGHEDGSDLGVEPNLGTLDETEQLILSENYQGKLVVHLGEMDGANGRGVLQYAPTESIKSTLESHPNVTLKPILSTSPEQIDARRKELEELSGTTKLAYSQLLHLFIQSCAA